MRLSWFLGVSLLLFALAALDGVDSNRSSRSRRRSSSGSRDFIDVVSKSHQHRVFRRRHQIERNILRAGRSLYVGHELLSKNKQWRLVIQYDHIIAVYRVSPRRREVFRKAKEHVPFLYRLTLDRRGDLAAYSRRGKQLKDISHTGNIKCARRSYLLLQNDGNLAIYSCGRRRWELHDTCKNFRCSEGYKCEPKYNGGARCRRETSSQQGSGSRQSSQRSRSRSRSRSSDRSSRSRSRSCGRSRNCS